MKKLLLSILLGLSTLLTVNAAPFTSIQLATTSITAGYLLQATNGSFSQWVSTSSLGIIGGSGISNAYASSTFPSLTYGTSTYVTYPYATSTYLSFLYGSSTFVTGTYASGTFMDLVSNQTAAGLKIFSATTTMTTALRVGTTTQSTAMFEINNQDSNRDTGVFRTIDTSASGAQYDWRCDSPNCDAEWIETDVPGPAGKFETALQGGVYQINGRSASDLSYENAFQFIGSAFATAYQMAIVASTTSATLDALRIRNSVSSAGAAPGISWFTDTGNFQTARMSSAQGASGAAAYWALQVANPSKSLTERMRITVDGNVGIATSTPTDKLQVNGNITPALNSTFGLGSSTLAWLNLFTTNASTSNLTSASSSIGVASSTAFSASTGATLANLLVTSLLNVKSTSTLSTTTLQSALADSVGSVGTTGQILQSTGSSTLWITNSASGVTGTGIIGKNATWLTSTSLTSGALLDNGTVAGINATSATVSFLVGATNLSTAFQVIGTSTLATTTISLASTTLGLTAPSLYFTNFWGGNGSSTSLSASTGATIAALNVTGNASTTNLTSTGLRVVGAFSVTGVSSTTNLTSTGLRVVGASSVTGIFDVTGTSTLATSTINGFLGIGTTTNADPSGMFPRVSIDLGATFTSNAIGINGSLNSYLQGTITNRSQGASAEAGWTFQNASSTATTNFGWIGLNGANFSTTTGYTTGSKGDFVMISSSGDMYLTNTIPNKNIFFQTRGQGISTASTTALTINFNGYLGIGTTTPLTQLSVATGSISNLQFDWGTGTSTSMTIDWNKRNNQKMQIANAAITVNFINGTTTPGQNLTVFVCNPTAGTAGAITWSGVYWSGGTIPTQTKTANKCDMWSFKSTYSTSSVIMIGALNSNF